MITFDDQGRINLSKTVADEINSKTIYLHLQSISERDHLILSSSCEDDIFMIASVTLDSKNRITLPKKVLDALGWTTYDSIIIAKKGGRWQLFKL